MFLVASTTRAGTEFCNENLNYVCLPPEWKSCNRFHENRNCIPTCLSVCSSGQSLSQSLTKFEWAKCWKKNGLKLRVECQQNSGKELPAHVAHITSFQGVKKFMRFYSALALDAGCFSLDLCFILRIGRSLYLCFIL